MPVTAAAALLIATAFMAAISLGECGAEASLYAGSYLSAASDTLALPGEVFVVTAEELARFDINSIADIIEHLPGVNVLQDGPPGSKTLYTIDGRTVKGMTLLVNGVPYSDPYNEDPLARFLTLSRVRRVEVIYSSSPTLTGRASSGGVINVVVEEGGRRPPVTAGDFSWGGNGRKARRAWFSSPDAFINGTITYDEYMQDYMESVVEEPSTLVGKYSSRSVMLDLTMRGEADDRVLVRLRTFEDSYTGTRNWPEYRDPLKPPESVRYSGMDSEIRYVRGGAEVSLRQRLVEMTRRAGWTSGLVLGGAVTWNGLAGSTAVKGFVSAERTALESYLWGEYFAPDIDRAECGLTLGGNTGELRWRGGISAGSMTGSGFFAGGEAALSRGNERGLYQTLMAARRVRTPTAEELYQPELERLPDGTGIETAGNIDLGHEISDEITLGLGYGSAVRTDIFVRFERSRISLEGSAPAVYMSEGSDDVIGLRASLKGKGSTGVASFDYGWRLTGYWFADRAEITPGVPEYHVKGGLWLSRPSFRKTELLTVRVEASDTGSRLFPGIELGRYALLDFSVSLTVLGAIARFEMKNVLDEKYETVPGMYMSGRHYRFGLNWRLFD
jgi:outer membrane receptor protein involved in Fe transport